MLGPSLRMRKKIKYPPHPRASAEGITPYIIYSTKKVKEISENYAT